MLDSAYLVPDHVSITEIDEESVLLNLENGQYFGLNHVGTLFLKQLQTELTAAEIVTNIALAYQVPESQVANDIRPLIDSLLGQQLISKRP